MKQEGAIVYSEYILQGRGSLEGALTGTFQEAVEVVRAPGRESRDSCLVKTDLRDSSLGLCLGRLKQQTFTLEWALRMSVHHIKVQAWSVMMILGPEQIKSGLACVGLMHCA